MVITLDALQDLHAHMEWADEEVWRVALGHAPAARDTRLRDLLLHLHNVQRAFLAVWTRQPLQWPDPQEFPDIARVHAWSRPTYAAARAFFITVDAAALARPVTMPWAAQLAQQLGRVPHDPTLAETIFQVTSHSTYHRGQINARLRELGAEPPLVDFIAWVWFGRPAPPGLQAAGSGS
jgi:uncharacterized damage-inducible protein DinB